MAFSGAHSSAKAADVAKMLLLKKRRVTRLIPCGVWRSSQLTV